MKLSKLNRDVHRWGSILIALPLAESIHDGSFFHDRVKLWVFLPVALVLGMLWLTGIDLFFLPYYAKWNKRKKQSRTVIKESSSGVAV